jgi:hypothetical protein
MSGVGHDRSREAWTGRSGTARARGIGLHGLAPLSATERLTVAALELLSRDPGWRSRLDRLASDRPSCPFRAGPAKAAISHAGRERDDAHPTCGEWLARAATFSYDIGCPSLPALLGQMELKRTMSAPGRTYRYGSMVVHRLAADARRPPRSRTGIIDKPAFLLLTRKWRGEPGDGARRRTLEEVTGMWLDVVDDWLRDQTPDRRDISFPAWREWSGRSRSRALLRLPPAEREATMAAWTRGGSGAEGAEISQAIRKGHARVELILRQALPLIPS